jgi:hypothetical protein
MPVCLRATAGTVASVEALLHAFSYRPSTFRYGSSLLLTETCRILDFIDISLHAETAAARCSSCCALADGFVFQVVNLGTNL